MTLHLHGGENAKPTVKNHPIINERIPLFDYSQYENVILAGQYSYPFTVHLPDWLPQSHLCFDTQDNQKKPQLNMLKV